MDDNKNAYLVQIDLPKFNYIKKKDDKSNFEFNFVKNKNFNKFSKIIFVSNNIILIH